MPESMNPSQSELDEVREANNTPQREAEAARLAALQAAEQEGKPVMPPRVEGYGAGSFQPETPEDEQQAA